MDKVVIVGAGPCGVLLAHYLLRRGDNYQIEIYDRRSDPRKRSFSNYRTYPLILTARGMNALSQIEGLDTVVRSRGDEVVGGVSYQLGGKSRVIPRRTPLISIDRTSLAISLLEKLTANYDSNRLKIHFDCKCTQVDWEAREATFAGSEDTFTVRYDRLIGADGVRSVVRKNFLDLPRFEFEQKYMRDEYKTFAIPNRDNQQGFELRSHHIHVWRLETGISVFALPQEEETIGCFITFPRDKNPFEQLSGKTAVLAFFQQNFPEIGRLMADSEAETLEQKSPAGVVTIRCSFYHYRDRVLLLGDAAHAIPPSLGQGCNAAMEDVLVFDRILDECGDNWAEALPQFTSRRLPDAHALLDLCQEPFPIAKSLFFQFLVRRKLARKMHDLFPQRFSLFLHDLVSDTLMPYGEILRRYRGWVAAVKQSNQQLLGRGDVVRSRV